MTHIACSSTIEEKLGWIYMILYSAGGFKKEESAWIVIQLAYELQQYLDFEYKKVILPTVWQADCNFETKASFV